MLNYATIYRQNNLDSLWNLQREIEDFFEKTNRREWHPTYEIEEESDHYLLSMDVPGLSKDEIKLEILENRVAISGERVQKEKGLYYSERHYGKFQRVFTLPSGVDKTKIEAQHQDGVLSLYIPKAPEVKPQQIKISSGQEGGFFSKLIEKKSA